MKPRFALKPIGWAIVLAFVLSSPSQAHAFEGALDAIRGLKDEFLLGKNPSKKPAQPVGSYREEWGTYQSNQPNLDVGVNDGKPSGQDVRFRDERFGQVVAEPSRTQGARNVPTAGSERVNRQTPSSSSSVEASSANSTCANVARSWDGASQMAMRGLTDRAYAAYLKILSTCKKESELVGTVNQIKLNLGLPYLDMLADEPVVYSEALSPALFMLTEQRLYMTGKADKKKALAVANEIFQLSEKDSHAKAVTYAGWLHMSSGDSRQGEKFFRKALKLDRYLDEAREGLAQSLLAQGKADAALAQANRLDSAASDDIRAQALLTQANEAYQGGRPAEAITLVNKALASGDADYEQASSIKAWSLKASGEPAQAAVEFKKLMTQYPAKNDYAQGYVLSLQEAGQYKEIAELSKTRSPAAPIAKAIVADNLKAQGRFEEMAALTGQVSQTNPGQAGASIAYRNKSGNPGEGKLSVATVPEVAVRAPLGNGTAEVSIANLRLEDGVRSSTGKEARIAYETKGELSFRGGLRLSSTLGTTKAGFEAGVRRYHPSGYVDVSINRAPVIESVRSYSGVRDPQTGEVVGRVFKTDITLSGVNQLNPRWKLDYKLSLGNAKGTSTFANGFYEAQVSAVRDLTDLGVPGVILGPSVRVGGFSRNENNFNANDGGYFSPKNDIGVGLKGFVYQVKPNDRFAYQAGGYAGFTSRDLGQAFNSSGLQLEAAGAVSYLFGAGLIGSMGVSAQTSPDFNDTSVWMSLNVPFEHRTSVVPMDLIKPKLSALP